MKIREELRRERANSSPQRAGRRRPSGGGARVRTTRRAGNHRPPRRRHSAGRRLRGGVRRGKDELARPLTFAPELAAAVKDDRRAVPEHREQAFSLFRPDGTFGRQVRFPTASDGTRQRPGDRGGTRSYRRGSLSPGCRDRVRSRHTKGDGPDRACRTGHGSPPCCGMFLISRVVAGWLDKVGGFSRSAPTLFHPHKMLVDGFRIPDSRGFGGGHRITGR